MGAILAHGVGGRSDLPIPVWMAAFAAALVVLVSFLGVAAFWRTARFRGAEAGRPLPAPVQRFIDGRALRVTLRSVGLVVYALTVAVLALGADDAGRNPAPTWIFVWLWVGIPALSLLLGPVWSRLNPLRTIADGVRRIVPQAWTSTPYPERFGYWPAAVSLFVFVWLELAYKDASLPSTLLTFVVLYSVVHVGFGVRYGPEWFARADGFEVYSDLMGRLAPLGRRVDGSVVLHNPFDGLASLRPRPGLVAVVCTLLGSTAFDGFTRTELWSGLARKVPEQPGNALLGTVGLVAAIALVSGLYAAASYAAPRLVQAVHGRTGHLPLALFAHSLVPIVVGYTIAHYFSFVLFQGQAGYILASDPFGRGADLLGTAGWAINYGAVSTTTIGVVQVAAIVVGHVAGVIAAHDRALSVFPHRDQLRGQYSLIAAMVAFTLGGIGLLVGSG